ncbi:hypothetical protein BG011_001282 [Mortierella polycephala]|uniref:Ion transport domain-containing protein n=1 Tax=Mortierella polycephala TaxID=41804 RepID=A0A9P6U6G1_9FUNG|nr:hypothetical protein BG011_001282 [Mortierella polycephala]
MKEPFRRNSVHLDIPDDPGNGSDYNDNGVTLLDVISPIKASGNQTKSNLLDQGKQEQSIDPEQLEKIKVNDRANDVQADTPAEDTPHTVMEENDSASDIHEDAPMEDTLVKDIKDDDDANDMLSNAQNGCLSDTEEDKTVSRWYFNATSEAKERMTAGTFSQRPVLLMCSEGYQTPAHINVNTRLTCWSIDLDDYNSDIYNVILGISIDNPTIPRIKSITFTFAGGGGGNAGVKSEVVNGHNLAALCVSENGVSRWKLHHQLLMAKDSTTVLIVMEIRTSASSYLDPEAGYLDLHFVEFHPVIPWIQVTEPDLIHHQPYLWSIDVNSTYRPSMGAEEWFKTIITYDTSGDGSVTATLSRTETHLYLELWDTSNSNSDEFQHPTHIAGIDIAVDRLRKIDNLAWGLSLSWDGSQVALLDASVLRMSNSTMRHYTRLFAVYDCQSASSSSATILSSPPSSSTGSMTLSASSRYQHCPGLQNFHGYGKFHITALKDQDIKNELFMAWDMESVQVYSAFGDWKLLHTLSFPESDFFNPVLACHGRHFAWNSQLDDVVSIWNIDQGSLVHVLLNQQSTMADRIFVTISCNEYMFAIYRDGVIIVYWMATGAAFGSYTMPGEPVDFYNLDFVNGDTQLMLQSEHRDSDIGWNRIGLVLDVATMTVASYLPDIDACSPRYSETITSQSVTSKHGAKLDLIRLDDWIVQPLSHGQHNCDNQCITKLSPLSEQPMEYTSPSGLHFQAKRYPPGVDADSQSFVVLGFDEYGDPVQKLVLPPPPSKSRILWTYGGAGFLARVRQFVVTASQFIMVWNVPTTLEGDFELMLIWCMDPHVSYYRVGDNDDIWGVCDHHQLHIRRIYFYEEDIPPGGDAIRPCRNQAFCKETAAPFLFGLSLTVYFIAGTDESFRNAILRYVNTHINSYPDPEDYTKGVMHTICLFWRAWHHSNHVILVTALLDDRYGRWIPRLERAFDGDPLSVLIEKAVTEPQAMGLAEVIISYCIRKARSASDLQYLFPVLVHLFILVDPARNHSDLGLRILRQLAFLPVRSRSFIIDHHIIAHPPEFRLRFWVPHTRPLHGCKDPLLQLGKTRKHNPKDIYFNRDLFVATFDILWSKGSTGQQQSMSSAKEPISMIKILLHLVLHKCMLFTVPMIQCHDFTLEMLDNPAIAALVEYKCSVYNALDLAVFGLPLGGSIIEFLNYNDKISGKTAHETNIWFFGFSALFIALHLLFELRVNKTVCHFVTIIIRILGQIRVFFFIFFGGILAFTMATMHVLHPCGGSDCEEAMPEDQPLSGDFPTHLYKAIFSTFFLMGGRYDPVESSLEGDNWAFYTLMIVYFFFTVILMLNVLIALINVAFSVGDETWRLVWIENRLRYVQSAEEMSYHIPGFRESYNYFPQEIYYSATPQRVKSYHAKYLSEDSDGDVSGCDTSHGFFGKTSPGMAANKSDAEIGAIDAKELERKLKEQEASLKEEFKNELQEQLKEQQEQMIEQQQSLEAKMDAMMAHILALKEKQS